MRRLSDSYDNLRRPLPTSIISLSLSLSFSRRCSHGENKASRQQERLAHLSAAESQVPSTSRGLLEVDEYTVAPFRGIYRIGNTVYRTTGGSRTIGRSEGEIRERLVINIIYAFSSANAALNVATSLSSNLLEGLRSFVHLEACTLANVVEETTRTHLVDDQSTIKLTQTRARYLLDGNNSK